LQKSAPVTPLPEPAAKINEFADLFATDGDVAVEKVSKVFPDGVEEILDPVATFLKAQEREKFRIPEIVAEPLHKDGVSFEECAGITFRFTHENGQLVKSESRNAAGRWEVISQHQLETTVFVEEKIGKMLGVQDMEESLSK
jgi:hypothetical protein